MPTNLDVLFTLNQEGTMEFAELTASNIGRHLAVVLDGEIHTAPVIQTKIPGGESRIAGIDSDE